MKNNRGFTLAEIMVGMSIGVLVLLGIYSAVNTSQRASSGIERKIGTQQDAKTALDLMEMEFRMASFNPAFANGLWIDPTSCAAAANQDYKGIRDATVNSLTIEMDIDASSAVGDVANEIITYTYDTANLLISRNAIQVGIACAANPQPFLGDTVDGRKTVRVINNSLGIPVFRYYDGSGTDISASLPAATPNIRRVDITLAVETQDIDPSTNRRRGMIYSTSVILRNHF